MERLEMRQRAVGRDVGNMGQGKQGGRKPPRMGNEEEEAADDFAIFPASCRRLEVRLWSGCTDTLCRMLVPRPPSPQGLHPWVHKSVCKPLQGGERAEAHVGEKPNPSPNRTRGFPPRHPQIRGGGISLRMR